MGYVVAHSHDSRRRRSDKYGGGNGGGRIVKSLLRHTGTSVIWSVLGNEGKLAPCLAGFPLSLSSVLFPAPMFLIIIPAPNE